MKTNYVLIDYENVQPRNISLPKGGSFKIKVFLGPNQAKIPVETVNALQAHGPDAEYIQVDGNGSNALDFHIAYYIGRLAAENPGAYFHVISKDTGFDPLIKHLKTQKILCRRLASLAEIPQIKASSPKSLADTPPTKVPGTKVVSDKLDAVVNDPAKSKESKPRTDKTSSPKAVPDKPDKIDAIIKNLAKYKQAKPRTLKSLRNAIKVLFVNQLTDDELDKLVGQLSEHGAIKITDDKVSYALA